MSDLRSVLSDLLRGVILDAQVLTEIQESNLGVWSDVFLPKLAR